MKNHSDEIQQMIEKFRKEEPALAKQLDQLAAREPHSLSAKPPLPLSLWERIAKWSQQPGRLQPAFSQSNLFASLLFYFPIVGSAIVFPLLLLLHL